MIFTLWQYLTFFTLGAIIILSVDDFFIDVYALVKRLGPKKLSEKNLVDMNTIEQKRIAIIVANWHEDEILERMIHGNIGRIDYQNYSFFLGVYPNDYKTLNIAKKLESNYQAVTVVVNSKDGPTSKGQMLNEMIHFIRAEEIKTRVLYDVVLMQDSEDIIHPQSLKLINLKMEQNDFLQTPVFSLPTKWTDLTRGTYIDEFAESHTRDMLVRSHLRAAVPSAGVGTAMSHLFISDVLKIQDDQLLKEDTLTEDYHLGIMAKRLGYASEFICHYIDKKKSKDYIATREYFPALVNTSIRQKTRWTLGISLQGYQNLRWSDTFKENYFLWRDRRGLINTPILILSYLLTLSFLFFAAKQGEFPQFISNTPAIDLLFKLSFIFMTLRLVQRFRMVYPLYGFKTSLLIPLRWILANYINSRAALSAIRQFYKSLVTGEKPAWVKTTHELPEMFGLESDNDLVIPSSEMSNEVSLDLKVSNRPRVTELATETET
jgi:adsorption protein B